MEEVLAYEKAETRLRFELSGVHLTIRMPLAGNVLDGMAVPSTSAVH